ncbi:hypothetical protein B0H19DRAFT_1273870 [Mycena capillaripes]|nr:hypothetical protein B0H19DRAFT_1273870 [Mycena capillaripes]
MDPLQLGRVHRASPSSLSNWLNAQLHTGGVISKGVDLWTNATDEAFPRPATLERIVSDGSKGGCRGDNHRLDMLIYDLRGVVYFKITAIHSGRLVGPVANILILCDVEETAIYDKIASSFDKVCEHPPYFSFLRFPAFDVGLYEARGWSTTRLGRARMGFPRGCAGNACRVDT